MINNVGDLKRVLAGVDDTLPVRIVERYGEGYADEFQGAPTGHLLRVMMTILEDRVELDTVE